ncbi:MAG TPA: DUF255 domain-containing protein [Phaeodactylibacter sp.]|nr:DUF255 domain-containing protein [Phaeodactylibacter sp.]
MKKIIFVLLILTPLLLTQCKSSKKTATTFKQGVNFTKSDNLTDIVDLAKKENKLVFIDFYTSWCQPCKMMSKDVFTDKEIGKFFNKKFVNYKVNAEKGNGPNIAALYNVQAYPTLIWLDTRGRVIERNEGAAYHTKLMQLANNAILNSSNSGE